MKQDYNLKKIIDSELNNVVMNRKMEEAIKDKCLRRKQIKYVYGYNKLSKIAVWFIGIILAVSGTAYAVTQVDGFSQFIDEALLGQVTPHIQVINKENTNGDVKMVLETAITDHYNSLFVFSFINEGDKPWQQGIEAGRWEESWVTSASYGPPTLSEDGRRLTYYIDGFNDKNILEGKKLKLKASNLITIEEIEEEIDIPIGEIFEKSKVSIDIEDYDFQRYNGADLKLYRLLKKEGISPIVLKQEPGVIFEGVGLMKDSVIEDPNNPKGGLTLYTRSDSNKLWTGTNTDYIDGYISEVTDVRTGKIYKSGRSVSHDNLFKGALSASRFREIRDESQIPYLRATKITYVTQKVIEKGTWKVEFEVEDTTTLKPVDVQIKISQGDKEMNIEEVNLSIFGVTTHGIGKDPLAVATKVKLKMKDGSYKELPSSTGMITGNRRFSSVYTLGNVQAGNFIDIEQVEAILINDKIVCLESK